jgi:hypothetical protein
MKEYRHMGDHAEELAGGRPVGPGEAVELSAEDEKDPHNKSLIEQGIFVPTAPDKKGAKKDEGGEG